MAVRENENVLFRPGLLARVLLGIVFTAITGTAVWFAADNYLPSDRVYSQRFVYTVDDDFILSWQKRNFLELKFIQFKNIANARFPMIARWLKADYDVSANTLVVYAVFPDIKQIKTDQDSSSDYAEKFSSFINLCHLSEVDPSENLFDTGGSDYKIKLWIKKNNKKLKDLESEYTQLQIQLQQHEQKILDLMIEPEPGKKADTIENPDSNKNDLSNGIDELRTQLKQLEQEQKDLDFRAAKCNSSSDLELIDSDKNKIFAKRQKIIAGINNLEKIFSADSTKLTQAVLSVNNPSGELKAEKERCESVRYKMKLMKNTIAQLQDDINFVEGFIGRPVQITGSSEEFQDQINHEKTFAFFSKFSVQKPVSKIDTSKAYSFLQILAISLSLILGWFIGMTTYSKIESLCQVDVRPDVVANERFCDSMQLADAEEPVKQSSAGVSDNAQTYTIEQPQPSSKKKLHDFEPWWVEGYDRLAYQLLKHPRQKKNGIIISSLDKSKASPRFAVNLAISLSLKDQKVLLASASDDGMLEQIFTDFNNESSDSILNQSLKYNTQGSGFWHCLENKKEFHLYSLSTNLENLKFIPSGTKKSKSNINNEINNNSRNAEMISGSYFDWILVYNPELFAGGIKGFEARTAEGPITLLLNNFKDIALIDFMSGNARRKESAVKKVLANYNCRLLEFI